MKIVDRNELGKMPNGTVFALYTPIVLYHDIHILVGGNGDGTWLGEIELMPEIGDKLVGGNVFECSWPTYDTATCDYYEDQLFAVFSDQEVKQMIKVLMWALSGCEEESYTQKDYKGKTEDES